MELSFKLIMNSKEKSIAKGISFGLTSGVITTLGLLVGLESGTGSKTIVIASIFIIAFSDGISDALGMHLSEESNKKQTKEVWVTTVYTFFAKFATAMSFSIPLFLFSLSIGTAISVIWGTTLITALSFLIAKNNREKPVPIILEHLLIMFFVIAVSNYMGKVIFSII